MKYQNDRLELAIIFSILLHFVLIVLFWLGSLFTYTALPSAGGNGGESDNFEAIMVDTGQVAAQYGKIKNAEKIESSHPKENPTAVEEVFQEEVSPDDSVKLVSQKQQEEKRLKEIQQQKVLEQERKKQAELQKQQQQEEATQKKQAEQARLKAEAEAKKLEALAKQAEIERKAKELELKKLAEQRKLKAEQEAKIKLDKEKAEEEEKARAEKEAKMKAELEAKAKAEKEAKAKAEKEAKVKAELEAKIKAEKEAKAKSEREAKAKADKEAKAKEAARALSLLEGGDVTGGNRNSGAKGSGGTTGVGSGANVDGSRYLNQISRLLKSRFKNATGVSCFVKIFLERDGTIKNYQIIRGPSDVCVAAERAVLSTKKVPPAPSEEVYRQYSSPTIEFRP